YNLSTEAPWVLFRLLYGAQGPSLVHMIACFDFGRSLIVQGFMQSARVPPVDPLHGLEFDLGGCRPAGPLIDQLGLIQPVDCLISGILGVISISADRGRPT